MGANPQKVKVALWFRGVSLSMNLRLAFVAVVLGFANFIFDWKMTQGDHIFSSISVVGQRRIPRDGCGLADEMNPKWVDYTEEDFWYLQRIGACTRSLSTADFAKVSKRQHMNLTKLSCALNVSDIRSIVSQYRRVWFIGDSVMRQVYQTMLCMMDHSIQSEHIYSDRRVKTYRGRGGWITTFPLISNFSGTENITAYHNVGNGSLLLFSEFGWLFDGSNRRLFDEAFPEAIRTSTTEDAIVVNAGHHYDVSRVKALKEATSFISNMSYITNATIFFLEAADEQWRSSNGMFLSKCVYCPCEPLGLSRIRGLAIPNDDDIKIANASGSIRLQSLPLFEDFGEAYPGMFDKNGSLLPAYSNSSCLPYCAPADWRTKVALPMLQSNRSRVKIVPVWRQMISRNMVNTISRGDCTHRATDTLIEMNRQLARSMLHSRYEKVQENGESS